MFKKFKKFRRLWDLATNGCSHEMPSVVADICQRDAVWLHDGKPYNIQWCMVCGAYRNVFEGFSGRDIHGDWTTPMPMFNGALVEKDI